VSAFWRQRRVFMTGHSGFMGGWLSALMCRKGAQVHGLALAPPTDPSFFEATRLADHLASSTTADVRDFESLSRAMQRAEPSVVFHLAAQPLVRRAHAEPLETLSVNVMGTALVLEAARTVDSVEAVIVVTTDKVYRNLATERAYVEGDQLGGREPYSASKAACEHVVDAWRHSFLADRGVGVATIRAGNIFGGGDWAADRLVPDAIVRFQSGEPLTLRNPRSTRPWQHVLDPLPGYLALAERLVADREAFSEAWNFGPRPQDCWPVEDLARALASAWGERSEVRIEADNRIFEERLLVLDSSKATQRLGWKPRWRLDEAVVKTVDWYRAHSQGEDMWRLTQQQIDHFEKAGEPIA